ncbi:hypothetical protein AYI69_g3724 [Smittium culicis]|uniref:Uncharacterized protein n=1 Tax=Smittium culicis TaxID=133412 RepID=A0A1R1YIW1_9FUNG|nr:hypothetical protein AYI69_g3724 [Smittium culicis]
MRTSTYRTIGRTPAEMVYGCKLMTPEVWGSSQPKSQELVDPESFVSRKVSNKERMFSESKSREENVKRKSKNKYDQSVRERNFNSGELVLRSVNRRIHPMGPAN